MDNSAVADLPMGEFWTGNAYRRSNARNRLVVSGGHLQGRRIVGAEAFTSAWKEDRFTQDPFSLKALADFQFCEGFNRFYFHDFTHQPWVDKISGPGVTMGPWGMHFARTVTWWDQGKPWMDYVTRCQYLLQAGEPVADLFCYSGEDAGAQPHWQDGALPPIPPGYDFEFVNASLLLEATVRDGQIVLPRGQKSQLLVLPDTRHLTPAVAQKLSELVKGGAVLVGPPPVLSPSLDNYPACDSVIRGIATEVWGDCDGVSVTQRVAGKGKVYWGKPLGEILTDLGLPPDFACAGSDASVSVAYKHRRDSATEIYFVSNQSGQSAAIDCRFRVTGKAPELWHADTGIREPAPLFIDSGEFITVPLRLEQSGSVFVVFREPGAADHAVAARGLARAQASAAQGANPDFFLTANEGALVLNAWSPGNFRIKTAKGRNLGASVATLPEPIVLDEDWDVAFPPKLGAPASIRLPRLVSLSQHAEPGVRYFSGTATYTREFEIAAGMLGPTRDLFLDLGLVKNLAQIKINGADLGILWKAPFRVLATHVLRPGSNRLEVRATNLWANRLIGDEHLADDCEWLAVPGRGWRLKDWPTWLVEGRPRPSSRVAFATWRYYDGSEALPDSGLLGPVLLRSIEKVKLTGS